MNNWPAWVRRTDPADRDRIKDILLSEPIVDYKSFMRFCQAVMAEVLCGNIPPDVAGAAKEWGELVFASLAAERIGQGGGLGAILKEAGKMEDHAPAPLIAQYTIAEVEVDREGVTLDIEATAPAKVVGE